MLLQCGIFFMLVPVSTGFPCPPLVLKLSNSRDRNQYKEKVYTAEAFEIETSKVQKNKFH